MSLPHDLLEQANHLCRRERRRPKQASLRRAVSTAYYAVFRLMVAEAVAVIGVDLSPARKAILSRWFSHFEMKRVCKIFQYSPLPKGSTLATLQPSTDLRNVADIFVRLQEARHSADYDLAGTWNRWKSQQLVISAQNAFESWQRIKGSEEANLFLLSLVMWKHFQQER